ncbi:thioesterase II family protein [Pseudoalteromonas luteoviolacea]|uniref:thioesterase II family protein n=1 Tax=Pseudoalteromonas luteoviolacea TaxID=43657 RepID=UPI001B373189|nr:thioesterase [Pseudoalteromonas luteoviolacea]MBQ4839742.1 thioesterase [Pseudoalteromonas luteoviolacea]
MSVDKKRVVYAFPHLGAGAAVYNAWSKYAQEQSQLLFKAIEIPGRGALGGEAHIQELDELVNKLADALHLHYVSAQDQCQDWITFGHSFGGVISMAVNQLLERKYGMRPTFSIISASPAPCVQEQENLHLLSDEAILEKIRRDKGTPEAVLNQPLIANRLIKQLRSDYTVKSQFGALKHMRVKQPLTLITASKDFDVPERDVFAWQEHSTGKTKHVEVAGDHFAIYDNWDVVEREMLQGLVSEQPVC